MRSMVFETSLAPTELRTRGPRDIRCEAVLRTGAGSF